MPTGDLSTLVLTKASDQTELQSAEMLRVRLASQDVAKHPFHLCHGHNSDILVLTSGNSLRLMTNASQLAASGGTGRTAMSS